MVGVGGIVSVGGSFGGSSGGSTSGIVSINGAVGPAISLVGISGVFVVPIGNSIAIGVSNKYAEDFTNMSSGVINHNLDTLDVIVQVRDNGIAGIRPAMEIIPDKIIFDNLNNISLIFNVPQTGRVVILR